MTYETDNKRTQMNHLKMCKSCTTVCGRSGDFYLHSTWKTEELSKYFDKEYTKYTYSTCQMLIELHLVHDRTTSSTWQMEELSKYYGRKNRKHNGRIITVL